MIGIPKDASVLKNGIYLLKDLYISLRSILITRIFRTLSQSTFLTIAKSFCAKVHLRFTF
jgi:hypothetical protein